MGDLKRWKGIKVASHSNGINNSQHDSNESVKESNAPHEIVCDDPADRQNGRCD
jgi:hypothetical protein